MFCGECGKESVDVFKFCPDCGKPVDAQPAVIATPAHEVQITGNILTGDPVPIKSGLGGTSVKPGTLVFAAFSALSLLVSIVKGIVPIYFLEAALWAGAAWFWQRKKTHSETARGIMFFLVLLVAAGEVVQIAMLANSRSPLTPITSQSQGAVPAAQKAVDPVDAELSRIWAQGSKSTDPSGKVVLPASFDLECPKALPSGVESSGLKSDDLSKVTGTDGSLTSEQSYDSYYAPNGRAWNANLTYTNKTSYCVSLVAVELQLDHAGTTSNERHSIVFQPLLGPGQSQSVDVRLKIITSDRGEDVALVGWHTVKASGFPSGSDAPSYDENGFQIVKDPKDPFAAYGGHEIKPAGGAGPMSHK